MYIIVVLLMVVVPALEIWGLLTVGYWIGGWQTFLLILLTGFIGAILAKQEALKVWTYARYRMAKGEIPADSILDGICIFAGGLLLLTPGFITDALGFMLVLPATRGTFKAGLLWIIRTMLLKRTINFRFWRR